MNFINKYVYFLAKHHKKILPFFGLFFIFMFIQFVFITINLNTDGFLFKHDKDLRSYRELQHVFGNDDFVLIAIKGDVFSNEYLNKVYNLQQELDEHIPYLDTSTSIINVSQIYTEGDTLYVDDLLADFPEKQLSEEELQDLKNVVMNDTTFVDRVISKDGKYSTIILDFLSATEIAEAKGEEAINSSDDTVINLIRELVRAQRDLNEEDVHIIDGSSVSSEETVSDGIDSFSDFEALFTEDNVEDNKSKVVEFVNDDDVPVYLNMTENFSIYSKIKSLTDKYESDDFELSTVGNPVLMPSITEYLLSDLAIFFPILVVFMLIFTYILFKRKSAILLCLMVAGVTNMVLMGSMSLFNVSVTLLTNVLPLIMFTMSLGAVIHLLTLVYRKFDEGETKEEALIYGLSHSGWPIVLTSITSAAGIFSFYFSSIKPMRDFAMFGSYGLMFALFLTVVFVPLVFIVLPLKRLKIKEVKEGQTLIDNMLRKMSFVSFKYRYITFLVAILIVVVSVLGIKQVYFSHRPVEWLPEKSDFRKDAVTVDSVLAGSNQLSVFIDTKKNNGVFEPEFLHKLEQYEETMREYSDGHVTVGNVVSFVALVKKTNESLNNSYSIPEIKELVAQEVLLLENGGTDVLSKFVDLNYRYTKIILIAPDLDAVYFDKLLNYSDSVLADLFEGDDYRYFATGGIGLLARVINASIESAKSSYMLAFIVITILMILLTKNVMVGLISMIPNLLPLFFLLGIIGYTSINLDMFVLLVGSVLMGLAVDNTIHFIHVFKLYLDEGKNEIEAITATFLSTGKAMLVASVILASGFGVLIFARMNNFNSFGIMATVGIAVALFSDFFLTPALMSVLVHTRFLKTKSAKKKK